MYCYNTTSFRQYGVFIRSYLSPLMRNEAIRLCTPQKTTTQPLLPTHKTQRTRYGIYLSSWVYNSKRCGKMFRSVPFFSHQPFSSSLYYWFHYQRRILPRCLRYLVPSGYWLGRNSVPCDGENRCLSFHAEIDAIP